MLVPDLLRDGNPIPVSASQAMKVSRAVRARLPDCIQTTVQPLVVQALQATGQNAQLSMGGADSDKSLIAYTPVKTGTGYAASTIQLEFGARATGEPHQSHAVRCDMAAISQTEYFGRAITDPQIAHQVAKHKSLFFAEKASNGSNIDYDK